MSKVSLSPLITDIRNRMGNVVFSKWKDTNYARQYSSHSRGNTERQVEVREAFSIAVSVWKNMGNTLHSSWDAYALNLNMSGYNAFIKANVPAILEGAPMDLFKSTGSDEPASLSTGANPASGEISCVFSLPVAGTSRHVIFFAQRIEDGSGTDSIAMHDAGVNPSSPFVITGLAPGAEYFVYCIAADSDYAGAETVTAAAVIRTTAGA